MITIIQQLFHFEFRRKKVRVMLHTLWKKNKIINQSHLWSDKSRIVSKSERVCVCVCVYCVYINYMYYIFHRKLQLAIVFSSYVCCSINCKYIYLKHPWHWIYKHLCRLYKKISFPPNTWKFTISFYRLSHLSL